MHQREMLCTARVTLEEHAARLACADDEADGVIVRRRELLFMGRVVRESRESSVSGWLSVGS